MKRAKCKLCNKILEITFLDCVSCACGEIVIDWISNQLHATIKSDKSNIIFIDEDGNEILPKRSQDENYEYPNGRIENESSLRELLATLDAMAYNVSNLPQEARSQPITHSDFGALLTLLTSLFRAS